MGKGGAGDLECVINCVVELPGQDNFILVA